MKVAIQYRPFASCGVLLAAVLLCAAGGLETSGTPSRLTSQENTRASSDAARKNSKQLWLALSTTALAITGDVTLTGGSVILASKRFPLTLAREVQAPQLENIGKIFSLSQRPSSARLYRTLISSRATLLHTNTICSSSSATWMLAAYSQQDLSLAFFSGSSVPDLTAKAVSNGHTFCGTYSYARSAK